MRLSGHGNGKTSLSPIDPEELLQGLKLTTGKAAEFCDISRRQLCYWTDKGIIETLEEDGEGEVDESGARRVYDFTALRKVLLIKQLLEMGRGLKRATREAEFYLQQTEDEMLEPDADRRTCEEMLQQQTERLLGVSDQVRTAVQRGRVSPADMRNIAREVHYLLELLTYEDSATLQLQEDVNAINQFRALIDQLVLHVEDKVADTMSAARRVAR
ncbi:MAG: MerR family transcriptional regulator [Armatimonadota bacterium]